MKAATVTIVIVTASLAGASYAGAQSHIEAVPSVTVGSIYDDNLFAQAQGNAGHMLTVRPGLGSGRWGTSRGAPAPTEEMSRRPAPNRSAVVRPGVAAVMLTPGRVHGLICLSFSRTRPLTVSGG